MSQKTVSESLPHWNLDTIYPGLESQEFKTGIKDLQTKLDEMNNYLDEKKVHLEGARASTSSEIPDVIVGYIERMNAISALYSTLTSFVYGFVSTDSYNSMAKKTLSELEMQSVTIDQQTVRFDGWLGAAVKDEDELKGIVEKETIAKEHEFYIKEVYGQSRFLMSDKEEALAAELSLSGGNAWQKLHGTVTSQLKASFGQDGEEEEIPVTTLQNIRRTDPDENIRRRAFDVEIASWESVREPLAACLNGVKGSSITLNKKRGREDSLHRALDQARIDRATLETMMEVMKGSFPLFRRYFKGKAKKLNKESLAWWDIFAPLGESDRRFTYDETEDFIVVQFKSYSDRLAIFAERVFNERWIDAEPRDGKRGGGFCMDVPGVEESRILVNYDGSLDQLFTIAHELGHAFHNECHVGKTMLQRLTPMTLAETASNFCETIVSDAALASASNEAEELTILENFLIGASQVIVDIYSRFLFEKEVFERREKAELSADDFCEIMTRCQIETYGDGLDAGALHPYMWAWKPHYYSPELAYYNFPYAFGLMFGLGLYAVYKERGAAFIDDYEALLRSTGEGTAEQLALRFDIDLRKPDFWENSLSLVEARIDRYLELDVIHS
jgi:pepF/M3 family oligoendopeptidase